MNLNAGLELAGLVRELKAASLPPQSKLGLGRTSVDFRFHI